VIAASPQRNLASSAADRLPSIVAPLVNGSLQRRSPSVAGRKAEKRAALSVAESGAIALAVRAEMKSTGSIIDCSPYRSHDANGARIEKNSAFLATFPDGSTLDRKYFVF
jgi:hypothetical protein